MRVKLPLPRQWPIVDEGPPLIAEVLPGVTLTLGELEPLPADLRAWGDGILYGGHPAERVRIGQVQDAKTETGWPLTIFGSDIVDPETHAVVERRLHAIYRFDKYGGAAALRGANLRFVDAVTDEVLGVFLKGGPDWSSGQILALVELWEGIKVESALEKLKPPSPPPDKPKPLPPLY